MNVPKEIKTYCPKCKNHQAHSVSLYKAGKRRALAKGERRHDRAKHGYGGQKYPLQREFAKTTKKQTLRMAKSFSRRLARGVPACIAMPIL